MDRVARLARLCVLVGALVLPGGAAWAEGEGAPPQEVVAPAPAGGALDAGQIAQGVALAVIAAAWLSRGRGD